MSLNLKPLPKTENGSEAAPCQSKGGKAFDPDDPQSMEYLQGLHSRMQQQIPPEKCSFLTSLFALFGVPYPTENPTVTKFRERLGRPFGEIRGEATASPEEFMVRHYDPRVLERTEFITRLEDDFPCFPFYALYDFEGPDGEPRENHVVMKDSDAEDASLLFEGRDPKQPDETRGIADIFEKAAANCQPEEDDAHPEASVFTTRAAAEWLRFRADNGHPCEAQRLLWSGQGWYRIQVG